MRKKRMDEDEEEADGKRAKVSRMHVEQYN